MYMYTSLIPRLSCVNTRAWEWGYIWWLAMFLWLEFCLFNRAVPGEDGGSGSDEEGGRRVTFSYKSDRKAVREGPVDMGATLQLETEPEKRVNCSHGSQPLSLLFFVPNCICTCLLAFIKIGNPPFLLKHGGCFMHWRKQERIRMGG